MPADTAMSEPGHGAGGLTADDVQELAAVHGPALYRFARSLGADSAAAEDLVQDTFLRAFQRRDQYRDGSAVGWLRRILHNIAVDRSRAGSSREIPVEVVEQRWSEDSYTVDAAIVVERAELRAELEDGLVRLPFIYRAAVVMHDVEGWTVQEIADASNIALPAAKQRLRRGRMMLVTALAAGAERRNAVEGVPMACWDARLLVSDYLDNELDESDRSRVEAHLADCPTCPPLYAALVGVQASLGRLRDPDSVIRPGLAKRLSERLDTAHLEPPTTA
jgi:RNA polymerase sigma-70 factor (ECF subfamily)